MGAVHRPDQQPEIFPGIKTGIMDLRAVTLLLLSAGVLLAGAGCVSPGEPAVTPTVPPTIASPTAPPVSTPVPTTKVSLEPGPTETLPQEWPVSVTVEKSGLYSRTIIARFDGGKGLTFVSRMDVRVTFSDGTLKTGSIIKPKMGDAVEIMGTDGTDRVEVLLLMENGVTYRIIDRLVPYKGRT